MTLRLLLAITELTVVPVAAFSGGFGSCLFFIRWSWRRHNIPGDYRLAQEIHELRAAMRGYMYLCIVLALLLAGVLLVDMLKVTP